LEENIFTFVLHYSESYTGYIPFPLLIYLLVLNAHSDNFPSYIKFKALAMLKSGQFLIAEKKKIYIYIMYTV